MLLGTSAGYLVGSSASGRAADNEQIRMTMPRGVGLATLLLSAAAMVVAAIGGLVAIAPEAA